MKNTDNEGFIWNIQRYNVHDGEGIRTIVFLKGCPLRCAWCANPEGEKSTVELKVNQERCVTCGSCVKICPHQAVSLVDNYVQVDRKACRLCGKCAKVCYAGALEMLGKRVSVREIMDELNKDAVFYRRSGGGLTLSGGEALLQADFAARLLMEAKNEGLDTAVETCGAVPWTAFEKVLRYVDTFLFDLKHMDAEIHKRYTGMANTGILENAHRLAECRAKIIFRMPVIPGVNDTEENIKKTAAFAKACNAHALELLPYHELGTAKYGMLGREYALKGITPPSTEKMAQYVDWAKGIFDRVING